LGIRKQGPHVLRHSFAIRLLRQGVSVKAIGDTLGHHHVASTAVYLRLAVEELRIVAAPVPKRVPSSALLKPGWQKSFPRIRSRTGPCAPVPSRFRSGLQDSIQRYLAIKKALGRRFVHETRVLLDWDAFLYRSQQCSKTVRADTFHKWVNRLAHLQPTVRRVHMRIVRNFHLFNARDQSDGYIPELATFPKALPPRPPRLVSEDEMARVLATAERLLPSDNGSPLRAETLRIALLLLFCCGLRHGEVLRLRLTHFDSVENLLRIEGTKFYKSRVVPLASSVRQELLDYLELRRQRQLPMEADSFLIWSHRRPEPRAVYSNSGLLRMWRHLCLTVGVLDQRGRPPRLHDLRHSFAVNALQRWYANGEDAQAKLPYLAAYLGHVSPVSTHYYLHLTPELREAASQRFRKRFAAIFQQGGKI
jgi:integrase